jgi:hypothetical protein
MPRGRVDTAHALVNVVAMDAAHKDSAEWAIHRPLWQNHKLAL